MKLSEARRLRAAYRAISPHNKYSERELQQFKLCPNCHMEDKWCSCPAQRCDILRLQKDIAAIKRIAGRLLRAK